MRTRTVLMLSYLFPPVAGAGVFRTIRFVKHLREFGWKPVILSVQPETALYVGRIDSALCGEIPEGTTVERTRVLRPVASLRAYLRGLLAKMSGRKMGTARVQEARSPATDRTDYVPSRMLRVFGRMCDTVFGTPDSEIGWMFPAVSRGLRLIGQFHPSVVYSTGPPHSTHLIALVLHMLTGLPMVVDLRDPWARTVWMRGTGGFPQWLQRRCEGFCVRRAHRVILNTHTLREEFSAVYRSESPSKFVAIPNGYDHGLLDRVKRLQDDPALPKESGSIRLCHPGTVYGRRDLRPLVDALGLLVQAGHQVRFDQIGIVNNKQELSSYIAARGLEKVVCFHGQIPHEETLRLMASADVFLLSQPGTSLQVPGKLYEMLPFRRPIVALTEAQGATADIITGYGLGPPPSENTEAIASAILSAADRHGIYSWNGAWENALRAFDGRVLTGHLAEVLNECRSA